jgi:hypothetical protein
VAGDASCIQDERTYIVKFKDIISAKAALEINGKSQEIEFSEEITFIAKPTDSVKVILDECKNLENPDEIESAKVILSRYQRDNLSKMIMYRGMGKITDIEEFEKALSETTFPDIVKQACYEVMTD